MFKRFQKPSLFFYIIAVFFLFANNSFGKESDKKNSAADESISESDQASEPSKKSANEQSSNSNIFREIERSLVFGKQSTQNNPEFYQQQGSSKESDINIKAGDSKKNDEKSEAPDISIVVVNPKLENLSVREKEILAYNSDAVDQYEVAITLYKEVLAAEPENSYAKFSLAVIYQKLGQYTQAKTLYHQLLKSAPQMYEEIITNLLTIIIEESPKESIYMLLRLTTENPQSAYIAAQTAIAYEKTKDYSKAIAMMKKATEIDNANILYRYNLAIMYDKSEQTKEALEIYSSIIRDYKSETDEKYNISLEQLKDRVKYLKLKN